MSSSGHAPHPPLKLATPAEARGTRDRPAGLRAQRGHAHPACNRGGAARARSARRAIEVPGVARACVIPGCELRGLGLAEDDGAEVAQNLHDGRVALRAVIGPQDGPGLRRQSRGVDDVLHPDRNPEQGQAPCLAQGQLGLPGRSTTRAVRVDLDPRTDLGLRRFDALQALVEDLDRPEVARAQGPHRLDQTPGLTDGHVQPLRSIHGESSPARNGRRSAGSHMCRASRPHHTRRPSIRSVEALYHYHACSETRVER